MINVFLLIKSTLFTGFKFIFLICLLVYLTNLHVLAASLSDSEQQALSEWPNWVASSCSDNTSTSVTLSGNGNRQEAFNFFVSHGLSAEASAGLVGNFMQESGSSLDTHSDNGSHIGIAQWDTASRWPSLLKYEKGKDPYALSTQLDFVWHELNTDYKSSTLEPLKKSSSPEAAAEVVFSHYEIPGDSTLPARQANARAVYNKYKSSAPSSPTASPVTSATSTDNCQSSLTPTPGTKPDFIDLSSGTRFGKGALTKINVLLIHYTEGNAEGASLQSFFNGNGLGVQFNIGLTGKVYQYFPLNNMQLAWQAYQISTHSIGIEITGMDGQALLNNQVQFNSVVNTVKFLCNNYNIPCSEPKGDITHTSEVNAQGLLGHSEAPGNDHTDPDTKIVNGTEYNITTGKVWTSTDRYNSAIHAYMKKLRQALGYNTTP